MVILAARADAAEYCSLQVTVTAPSGKPVEERVVVEESNGWKAEQTSQHGIAKFCGLGIHSVSVTVGDGGCNQVIVRNVPLLWGETTHLPITYDDAPCKGETLPVAACAFLLRLIDEKRQPVKAVSLDEQKPFSKSYRGDEFGRVLIRIAAGQQLVAVASAKDYKPTLVSIPCESKNKRLEQIVVLERSQQ
jgi:hypothetical protein